MHSIKFTAPFYYFHLCIFYFLNCIIRNEKLNTIEFRDNDSSGFFFQDFAQHPYEGKQKMQLFKLYYSLRQLNDDNQYIKKLADYKSIMPIIK